MMKTTNLSRRLFLKTAGSAILAASTTSYFDIGAAWQRRGADPPPLARAVSDHADHAGTARLAVWLDSS